MALNHGMFVLNAPGIVDSDYRGEIGVIMHNAGRLPYRIAYGDRIAQALLLALPFPVAETFNTELPAQSATERGDGGFGSTGQ
jgi:dUTP pyrophosphatase